MTSQYRCVRPHKIYLAGSWKNQQEILLIRDILTSQGHVVDCFASENNGRISFNWSKLEDIRDKLPEMDAKDMLDVPRVQEAFKEDKKWLDWCDMCILILPSGKSAHLEAGYAKGRGRTVVIFGDLQKGDFDVMYGFADGIFRCDEIDHMIDFVNCCASHSDFQYPIPNDEQCRICQQATRKFEREKVLDELESYAESCRCENESRGKLEREEIIVAALAGASLAFGGMKDKIKELRKGGE